jgi:hypothetical protein
MGLIVAWLGLLAVGYCGARFSDPWPRDMLRIALHRRFAQERMTWKIWLFAECLFVLVAILFLSWPLVCVSISFRIIRLLPEVRRVLLRYHEGRHRKELDEVNPDRDPVLEWYESSWKLDFGKSL